MPTTTSGSRSRGSVKSDSRERARSSSRPAKSNRVTPGTAYDSKSGNDDREDDKEDETALVVVKKPTQKGIERNRIDKLLKAQSAGKMAKAIRLLYEISEESCKGEPQERTKHWEALFAWALPRVDAKWLRGGIEKLLDPKQLSRYLGSKDKKQIERDLPRTASWLDSNRRTKKDKSKTNHTEASTTDMTPLRNVLVGYVVARNKELGMDLKCNKQANDSPASNPIYAQGTNGVAFVLLRATDGDQERSIRFLHGITQRLLPTLLGEDERDALGQDQLSRTSLFFGNLLKAFFPTATARCLAAGVPPGDLVTRWMITLFTNVSVSGLDNLLGISSILACWDICFTAGMAGVAAVGCTLFAKAIPALVALPDTPQPEKVLKAFTKQIRDMSASQIFNGVVQFFTSRKHDDSVRGLITSHIGILKHKTRSHSQQKKKQSAFARSNSMPDINAELPTLDEMLGSNRANNSAQKHKGKLKNGKRSNRIVPGIVNLNSDGGDGGSDPGTIVGTDDEDTHDYRLKYPSPVVREGEQLGQKCNEPENNVGGEEKDELAYSSEWEKLRVISRNEEDPTLLALREKRGTIQNGAFNTKQLPNRMLFCQECKFERCHCEELPSRAFEWLQDWDASAQRWYYWSPIAPGRARYEAPDCGYISHDGVLNQQ